MGSLQVEAEHRIVARTEKDLGDTQLAQSVRSLRARPINQLFVTGFGKFHGVAENPTASLVERLDNNVHLLKSAEVLAVSMRTIMRALTELHAHGGNTGSGRAAAVHFGVSPNISKFKLELQARNEATFHKADEDGNFPFNETIDRAAGFITFAYNTDLPVYDIAEALRDCGHDCEVSLNAGSFICNWIYFKSLQMSLKSGAAVLFVHVPTFDKIDAKRQLWFAVDLLNLLTTRY